MTLFLTLWTHQVCFHPRTFVLGFPVPSVLCSRSFCDLTLKSWVRYHLLRRTSFSMTTCMCTPAIHHFVLNHLLCAFFGALSVSKRVHIDRLSAGMSALWSLSRYPSVLSLVWHIFCAHENSLKESVESVNSNAQSWVKLGTRLGFNPRRMFVCCLEALEWMRRVLMRRNEDVWKARPATVPWLWF